MNASRPSLFFHGLPLHVLLNANGRLKWQRPENKANIWPQNNLNCALKVFNFHGTIVHIPSTVVAKHNVHTCRLVNRPSCFMLRSSFARLITLIADIVPYHAHCAHCTHPTSSIESLLSLVSTILDFGMSC